MKDLEWERVSSSPPPLVVCCSLLFVLLGYVVSRKLYKPKVIFIVVDARQEKKMMLC